MFIKIIFFYFLIFFSTNLIAESNIKNKSQNIDISELLGRELNLKDNKDINQLLGEDLQIEFNADNINSLYKDFKSKVFKINLIDEPLYVIFNQDLDNIDISINNKLYIKKNKNKNYFISPNIIHLSSNHNKSFSYSLYLDDFYKGVTKKYSQHILLFHEIGHIFLENHANYFSVYSKEKLEERGSYLKEAIDETFSDTYGLVLLVKYFNIEKESAKDLFMALSFYRKKYKNYKYKGGDSIDLFYKHFMINFDFIINKSDIDIGHYIFKFNKQIFE